MTAADGNEPITEVDMKAQLLHHGQIAVRELYGKGAGSSFKSMADHRRHLFNRKVTGNTKAATCLPLPPTVEALTEQLHRIYLQVQAWLGEAPDATRWGYHVTKEGGLAPTTTSSTDIAPPVLMQFVKCGCKGACNSNQCSCYKIGVSCTEICTNCKGETCDNHVEVAGRGDPAEVDGDGDGDVLYSDDRATFEAYVQDAAADSNMAALRAHAESMGWDFQNVLAGGPAE